MKIFKLLILLVLVFAGAISLLLADASPIKGGLCFIATLVLGYVLNKFGWLLNVDDLCHR